jgi:hypothetical protein
MLRANGMGFIRSRYFVEDLERRGHNVRFAYFIAEDKEKWVKLQKDVISFAEVSEFRPDALIFELGSADRFPSRDWLNELKLKGCIVVHCGLDYNDYNQNRERFDEMYAGFGYGILKKKNDTQDMDELPDIRGSGDSQIARTDIETLKKYCAIQDAVIFQDVLWVESHHALVIKPRRLGYNVLLTAGSKSSIKAYNDWEIHGENNAIYGAFNDSGGIEILITGHFVTDGKDKAYREYNRTFLLNVLDYLHIHNPVRYKTESAQTNRAAVGEKTMWHIHPTEQWIDEVIKFMNERQLSLEDSKFMIVFFSSMDNEFVEYFKSNQSKISSFSGRSFHIFTPLIYEGNTIPDEHWRYMRNEFKALGIPVSVDPTFVFFSLDTRHRSEPLFFAGFTCSSFNSFPSKMMHVIETCIETDDIRNLANRLSEIFLSKNIIPYDQVDYQLKETITRAIKKSESSYPARKHKGDSDRESAEPVSILFLAADPTDASRLRLGEEFREIQEKLKLAQRREHFKLELPQLSVRPADITQALLDTHPCIVHFSGHGTSTGALCFENQTGQMQLVHSDALAGLFEQFTNQVNCVLLNACYSEIQAKAIAEHIEYVIGMNQAIGDKAAIAFVIGFYQALGAGRTIEDAYKLGVVQIRLQSIPEHLTPVLIKKGQV